MSLADDSMQRVVSVNSSTSDVAASSNARSSFFILDVSNSPSTVVVLC